MSRIWPSIFCSLFHCHRHHQSHRQALVTIQKHYRYHRLSSSLRYRVYLLIHQVTHFLEFHPSLHLQALSKSRKIWIYKQSIKKKLFATLQKEPK